MKIRWNSHGLLNDSFSIQNGILTLNSTRFPLCIDPQMQAFEWIKRVEEENNLKVCNKNNLRFFLLILLGFPVFQIMSSNDEDYLENIEIAIECGIPVLIRNIDCHIDPMLNNILEKIIECM